MPTKTTTRARITVHQVTQLCFTCNECSLPCTLHCDLPHHQRTMTPTRCVFQNNPLPVKWEKSAYVHPDDDDPE